MQPCGMNYFIDLGRSINPQIFKFKTFFTFKSKKCNQTFAGFKSLVDQGAKAVGFYNVSLSIKLDFSLIISNSSIISFKRIKLEF